MRQWSSSQAGAESQKNGSRQSGGVLIRLDDVRRPVAAVELWRRAHDALACSGGDPLKMYTFKQSQALALLESLGWEHERFYAERQGSQAWRTLSNEVMDAIECAASLLELPPGSVGGEKLLFALVRRVPALNQMLRALPPASTAPGPRAH